MNTTNGFFRVDTHRITFDATSSRCTGACEGEACNCSRPKHLEPAEAATDIGAEPSPIAVATARFWVAYSLLLVTMFGLWLAAGMGWLS